MESTLRLYHTLTLVEVLSQHRCWLDLPHLKTLAWMRLMIGLIQSGMISLTPYLLGALRLCYGRAIYAQSKAPSGASPAGCG